MAIIRESDIAPEERERLRNIGEDYATERVIAQLDRTRQGIQKFHDILSTRGVDEVLETLLANVLESLQVATDDRLDARVIKKVTNDALLSAMHAGKTARFAAHGVLDTAALVVAMAGNSQLAAEIRKVLDATRSAGADSLELQKQLRQLLRLAMHPDVRAQLGAKAEPLETQLDNAIAALEVARGSKSKTRGTPKETDYVNMLDGLAIELCRRVRKIARAAAKELNMPAIAKELDLRALYEGSGRRLEDDDEVPGDSTAD